MPSMERHSAKKCQMSILSHEQFAFLAMGSSTVEKWKRREWVFLAWRSFHHEEASSVPGHRG